MESPNRVSRRRSYFCTSRPRQTGTLNNKKTLRQGRVSLLVVKNRSGQRTTVNRQLFYSLRNDFTGLATAAFTA